MSASGYGFDPEGRFPAQPGGDGQFVWVALAPAQQVFLAPTPALQFLGDDAFSPLMGNLTMQLCCVQQEIVDLEARR